MFLFAQAIRGASKVGRKERLTGFGGPVAATSFVPNDWVCRKYASDVHCRDIVVYFVPECVEDSCFDYLHLQVSQHLLDPEMIV